MALRGHEDHVVVGLQIALLDALLVDEVERNAELIERVTVPAELLRAAPVRVESRRAERRRLHDVGPDGRVQLVRIRGAPDCLISRIAREDERIPAEDRPSRPKVFSVTLHRNVLSVVRNEIMSFRAGSTHRAVADRCESDFNDTASPASVGKQ
jgi:hypothetical protein